MPVFTLQVPNLKNDKWLEYLVQKEQLDSKRAKERLEHQLQQEQTNDRKATANLWKCRHG